MIKIVLVRKQNVISLFKGDKTLLVKTTATETKGN